MNLPELLMGVAAGIGILAALTQGLSGFMPRPSDRARIAFAFASIAAAVGALSVLALYEIRDIDLHVAVMKWAFFPSTVLWTVAIVWFVAFFADVHPRWYLRGLTAGFALTLVINAILPRGILHGQKGGLIEMDTIGGSVMVMNQTSPHVLQNITDALTLLSFAFLCYAVYRVARRPGHISHIRARYLGYMTVLLAIATFFDAVVEHRVVISFSTLYLSQVCFSLVIVAVSLALRGESLQVEKELQLYKTHMDDLVEARVRELNDAHARLAMEERERRAAENELHRRVEELNTLQRIAQIMAGRATLEQALGEATEAIAGAFGARYARVRFVRRDAGTAEPGREPDAWTAPAIGHSPSGSSLDDEAAAVALGAETVIAEAIETWPELTIQARQQAVEEGIGFLLAKPLTVSLGTAGALVIARDAPAEPFSPEEQLLAHSIGEALGAIIEIDRLHHREKRQAAAEERQALARDLHDAVTQSIFSAALIAEALPAVFERDPEEGRHRLDDLRRLVQAAFAELRTLLFELRPAALLNAPLDGLLKHLGDSLEGRADVHVDLEVEDIALPSDVKLALYRVTQEAFSNIANHARATRATARVTCERGEVALTITDDGRGFDPSAVPDGHLGLLIMVERLESIGGTFTICSAPGEGTTLRAAWLRSS